VLVAQGSTRYTQDLVAPLSQILHDGTATHVYGHARLASVAGSTRTWYSSDALGSVRQTLTDAGVVASTTSYDPWGVVQDGIQPQFGFTGELHSGSMVYLRARWYNSEYGIFTVRDPFAGYPKQPQTLSQYVYTENNPVNKVDPSGFVSIFIGGRGSEKHLDDPFNPQHMVGVWEMGRRFTNNSTITGSSFIAPWNAIAAIEGTLVQSRNICESEPVILVGHSLGAMTAYYVADSIEDVDLLVTLDAINLVMPRSLWSKPQNVKRHINIISEISIHNEGGIAAIKFFGGAENFLVRGAVHTTLDNEFLDQERTKPNPAWRLIEDAIREVLNTNYWP
jgi:RHS repeat-associated protein